MSAKRSRFISVVLLFGTVAAVCFSSARTISYPPSPSPWYCYSENIAALALLVPVAFIAGRLWYSLPIFFGFGVFLAFGPAMDIIGLVSIDERAFSISRVLILNLPIVLFCCAAGVLTGGVGLLTFRYFRAKAALSDASMQ